MVSYAKINYHLEKEWLWSTSLLKKEYDFVEVLYDHMKECLQEPDLSSLSIMAKKKNTMISFFESGKV
jgi:hypothetical protein